ncbi:phosphatase PAP2 family protein [Candidatus Uabimicrobium sp. HlEnr_7]|uniref:phosphatase PAP2 family protein n=1 Tax=Candidatus Uabimicrobium helgolandensis TaxID=3095367 RepID=UPI003555C6AF
MSWEVTIIQKIQGFDSQALVYFNQGITSLGEAYFFLIFLSVAWVIAPRRFSIHFTFLLLFTVLINTILKEIFTRPRPFVVHPQLQLFSAQGYSFPSGHAQIAVVFWGYLAYYLRNKVFWLISLTLILLIGISRVYLGVHYPTDVLCGWLVGSGCLAVYFYSYTFWQKHWKLSSTTWVFTSISSALLFHTELLVPTLGSLVGVIIGCHLAQKYLHFTTTKTSKNIAIRISICVLGTLSLYILGKKFFPRTEVIRFIHYAAILLWMSFIAPKLCCYKTKE